MSLQDTINLMDRYNNITNQTVIKTYHIISNPLRGWSVRKKGAKKAFKTFDTRNDAIAWGTQKGFKLVIHSIDGTVEKVINSSDDV